MPRLRYVGTIDELTPERVRSLRDRLRHQRDVWDANRGAMADESGLLVKYEVDPRPPGLLSSFRWSTVAAIGGGILLGVLLAGAIWWWNKEQKRNKRRRRKSAS